MQLSLFPEIATEAPYTEGIKYAGSKLRLLPYILQLANRAQPRTVFDGFTGTTRVAQMFARNGQQVITNDSAIWSKIFALCYLKNQRPASYYQKPIDHLNALPGKEGWFTEHYGGLPNAGSSIQSDGLKKPWQIHNAKKLDAIRAEIDNLNLNEVEIATLLTSLILALDEVDNTLGHYASYLNEWSPRSYNTMKLTVPKLISSPQEHKIYHGDIFGALEHVHADLAYYDPPYGSNNEKMPPSRVRYAAYYHLWTTICLNDCPVIFGKVKRRVDSSDELAGSVFEEFRKNARGRFIVVDAIERLLMETRSRFILLSYSSGGRATAEQLDDLLHKAGKVIEFVKVDYRRNVMADMRWTHEWVRDDEPGHQEYLFLIEKR
ncbi:DNA adenine methylase [Candidatus Uhrbacteria bacterium]|nr:DNA adenine methylase [Candidatus Uhrbacteria bacterium]